MKPEFILFFDTETTGINVKRDRIVQIAWVLTTGAGETISDKTRIIKPVGFTIPDESAQIHKITTEIANTIGENLSVVLEDFFKALERADLIVGHNLAFDLGIIKYECMRAEIDFSKLSKPRFCTMVNSAVFCRLPRGGGNSGYKFPKLSEAYEIITGCNLIHCHDALVDTEACKDIFFSGLDRGIWRYGGENSGVVVEVIR